MNGAEYKFSINPATSMDRFNVYWNGLPEALGVASASVKGETVVYKDHSQFKIRFDKNWDSANVYVYNTLGQLMHTAKNVNTSVDYLIPLNNNTVSSYVVKTVSSEGEIVTKKIVK